MKKQNVTLLVESKLYNQYKQLCKSKGIIISRQFEIMMENELQINLLKQSTISDVVYDKNGEVKGFKNERPLKKAK